MTKAGRSGRQRTGVAALAVATLALCWPLPSPAADAGTPSRIVSINLCTDQLLLMLAPRERIRALSVLADDRDVSAMPEAGVGLALTEGDAEEVLGYDPDLVVDGSFAIRPTVDLLNRLGRRTLTVPIASDLDGVRSNVRAVAAALGQMARGDAVIAELDRRLAAVATIGDGPQPRALVYYAGGYTSGAGTLDDAILAAAGFRNLATERGITGLGTIPLETLVADPPDLVVLGNHGGEYRTTHADNLRHPALKLLLGRIAHVVVPQPLLLCDTPKVADAVELIAAARRRLTPNVAAR
jgi:iron complex transport system substrate-binding protein